jgi:hypothetical protein
MSKHEEGSSVTVQMRWLTLGTLRAEGKASELSEVQLFFMYVDVCTSICVCCYSPKILTSRFSTRHARVDFLHLLAPSLA